MTWGREAMVEVNPLSLSLSFFLSLISVFNPSISYRGALTGSSHCGPAGLPVRVRVCVCVSVCVILQVWTRNGDRDSRHGGRACSRAHLCVGVREPYLLQYLVYWVNPCSQAPMQLPGPAARLPPPRHRTSAAFMPLASEHGHKGPLLCTCKHHWPGRGRITSAPTHHTHQTYSCMDQQQWCLMRQHYL